MSRSILLAAACAAAVSASASSSAAPSFTLLPLASAPPIPTPQQLQYQGGISALIHFGMATFFHDGDPGEQAVAGSSSARAPLRTHTRSAHARLTTNARPAPARAGCTRENWLGCDPNGGCNSSDVNSFAPTNLNVTNWVESFVALGATSAVLTAKHGCGFLAWETATTLPDGSAYRYHVSAEQSTAKKFVAATTAAGIGHGFYYSLTNNFYVRSRTSTRGALAFPSPHLAASALPGPAAQRLRTQRAAALDAAAGPGECDAGAVRGPRAGAGQGALDRVRLPL